MRGLLTGLAALASASLLLPASPAMADFKIAKPKPKAAPAKAGPARGKAAAAVAGINPVLVQDAIVQAKFSATLARDPAAHSAVIQATDGKTGWSVTFKDCAGGDRCRAMEFYTLWPISNEANVCAVWSSSITRDPGRTQGKPYCYTLPEKARQFHLILSSDQSPYKGMERLGAPQMMERMQSMIGIWKAHLAMMPMAWTMASEKCPRAQDRCV